MIPRRSELLHHYGHAGGHLRDALLNALEYDDWWNHVEVEFYEDRDNRWFQSCSAKRRAQWLLGQLWHCTDVVPGLTRQEIAINAGLKESQVGTYARLSRYLAQAIRVN